MSTNSPPPQGEARITREPSEAMIEEAARLICFIKGYDPDAPTGENRVQWQTFTELARQTVVRIAAPSGEDGERKALQRILAITEKPGLESTGLAWNMAEIQQEAERALNPSRAGGGE